MGDERSRKREDMMRRTRKLALAVIRLTLSLPGSMVSRVLGRQILGSGTSVGAHYREACRAKSRADFISKIEGALQELDETMYWLELIEEVYVGKSPEIMPLKTEAGELISIFVSVVKSLKSHTLASGRRTSPHPS